MSDPGTFDPSAGGDLGVAPTDTSLFGVDKNTGQLPVTIKRGEPVYPIEQLGPGVQGPVRRAAGPPTISGGASTNVIGALEDFYQLGDDSLTQIQQALLAGHFYSDSYYARKNPRQPQFGSPDEDTFAAYKRAVIRAARSHKPLDEVLLGAMDGQPGDSTDTTAGAPPPAKTISLTNPADVRFTAQKMAPELIGRRFNEGELARFVAGFSGAESASQTSAYNQTYATDASGTGVVGPGGTTTQAPAPAAAADQYARTYLPGEVGGQSLLRQYDVVAQLFGATHGAGGG